MLATKFFPQTFRKFQRLISRNQLIDEKILKKSRNPLTQLHISNLYSITNLISTQLSELQSPPILSFLESFYIEQERQIAMKTFLHASELEYNEHKNHFILKRSYELLQSLPLIQTLCQVKDSQKSKTSKEAEHANGKLNDPLEMNSTWTNLDLQQNYSQGAKKELQAKNNVLSLTFKINNCKQQKLDHPSIRKTLYFHELKDIDDYVKYSFLPKTPLFIQDMNRKKLQMKVLDKTNPFGLPLKSPPLLFEVQLEEKIYFTIKSTFQQTNITEIGSFKFTNHKKSQKMMKKFSLSGMKIPRTIQNVLYDDILNSLLKLNDQQILRLHKLAYIGGRVQKLNLFMDVHQTMCIDDQDEFQKKLDLL